MTIEELNEYFEYRDGDLWWRERRHSNIDMSKPAGSIGSKKYRNVSLNNKSYLAHRLIYLLHNPDWDISDISKNNQIDHINGDRLDNRIENLRLATQCQNQYNRPAQKNNQSGHKNISWDKTEKKWKVRMQVNGKYIWGGAFINMEDAIVRATQLREKYCGEFANHGY